MGSRGRHWALRHGAFLIALAYVLFGSLWILITDYVLFWLAPENKALLHQVGTLKGVIFVILSGGLIHGLVLGRDAAMRAAQAEARRTREQSDDTTRRQAELLTAVLESVAEAVIVCDRNEQVTVFNAAAEALFGAVPRTLTDLRATYDAGPPKEDMPLTRASHGESTTDLLMFIRNARHPDGRWISVTGRPLTDAQGALIGGVAVCRDVTEERRATEEIRRLNADLEHRVEERTAQLEVINHELGAFSYSVSHDLRAPLRAIDGFSRMVLEDYGKTLPEDGRKNLERVRAAVARMGELIDGLLVLSRVSRAELRDLPVDLSAVAQSVLDNLAAQDPTRKVTIHVEPDLRARGDPALLTVVLENLLGNAWKFTSKTPEAVIRLSSTQQDGKTVYQVSDNGAGFDMNYAHRLFGAFERLHSTAEFPGTGVGLATVKRIVVRHGGRIWAVGEPGKGATFSFTLHEE